MLTDRYDLPLSTASAAARDAYVLGCDRLLTMYPGAIEAFDRAIAARPRLRPRPCAQGAGAARGRQRGRRHARRWRAARSVSAGLPAWERSHIAFFDLLVAGEADAALAMLRAHLKTGRATRWPSRRPPSPMA